MCWSHGITILFVVVEAVLITLVCILPACKPYRWHAVPLLLSPWLVEVAEIFMHLHPEPLESRLEDSPSCHPVNTGSLLVASFVITLQPLLGTHMAKRTEDGNPSIHTTEIALIQKLGIAFVVCFWFGVSLTYLTPIDDRLVSHRWGAPYTADNEPITYYYFITCAYNGPNGHLMWQIAYASQYQEMFPNAFFYMFLLCWTAYRFYDKVEAVCLYLFMGLYFGMILAWNMGEASSTWCWSGVLLDVFYVVYPHVKQWREWKTVTDWCELLPSICLPSELRRCKSGPDSGSHWMVRYGACVTSQHT